MNGPANDDPTTKGKSAELPARHAAALKHFDDYPDSAGVRLPVVARLNGVSDVTVWRWVKANRLPAPTKRGGVALWNVGELRRAMKAG